MKSSKNWTIFLSFVLVLIIFFLLGVDIFSYLPYTSTFAREYTILKKVVNTVIIITLAVLFMEITSGMIRRYLQHRLDSSELKLILSVYRYAMISLLIVIGLIILYRKFSTIILSVSIIGFGLTLSLQKPIINFVGWISIIIGKPFRIGDRISIGHSSAAGLKGVVYNITPMYTSLAELDENLEPAGKSINVPNEQIFTQPIINMTKGSGYIWDELKIKVSQSTDYNELKKVMLDVANKTIGKEMKKVLADLKSKEAINRNDASDTPVVRYDVTASSIALSLRYMVNATKKREIKSSITEKLIEELKRRNITLKE